MYYNFDYCSRYRNGTSWFNNNVFSLVVILVQDYDWLLTWRVMNTLIFKWKYSMNFILMSLFLIQVIELTENPVQAPSRFNKFIVVQFINLYNLLNLNLKHS